jgi:Flp pilus assembly protein TadG
MFSKLQLLRARLDCRGGIHRQFRRAGALLEMVLVLSLLLSLTFGSVEFSYYFYVKNAFEGAARDGARAGAPWNASNSAVTTAVTQALAFTGWPAADYTVSITDTSGNALSNISTLAQGTQFEVTISATWGTIGNGYRPLGLIGASKVVTCSCVMAKED